MRTGLATAMGLAALALAACSPAGPDGVSKAALDNAVNDAVGDPNTCVLIGKRSGGVAYQYGTHVVCAQAWPSCADGGTRSPADLLKMVANGAPPVAASCPSNADGSRGVAWAAGPIEGHDLDYAATMEGTTTPPGRVVAEKLRAAFKKAGL